MIHMTDKMKKYEKIKAYKHIIVHNKKINKKLIMQVLILIALNNDIDELLNHNKMRKSSSS